VIWFDNQLLAQNETYPERKTEFSRQSSISLLY
jgi:hypothetical protein